MRRVYIGLGSNLAEPVQQLGAALAALVLALAAAPRRAAGR